LLIFSGAAVTHLPFQARRQFHVRGAQAGRGRTELGA